MKEELRYQLIRFLRQRRKACVIIGDRRGAMLADQVLQKFDLIREWSYWRHCLEVKNNEVVLRALLPSGYGKHSHIREVMSERIKQWVRVANTRPTLEGAGFQMALPGMNRY